MEKLTKLAFEGIEFDERIRSFQAPVLGLPGVAVRRLFIGNREVGIDKYRVSDERIELDGSVKIREDDSIIAYAIIPARKTKILLNSAVAVAIVGLLGTIFQVIWPDIARGTSDDVYHVVAYRNYGINDNGEFEADLSLYEFGRDKEFVFDSDLDKKKFWYFVRIVNDRILPEDEIINNIHGGVPYLEGHSVRIKLDSAMYDHYLNQNGRIGLVGVLADETVRITNGSTLRAYGDSVRVVLTSSVWKL